MEKEFMFRDFLFDIEDAINILETRVSDGMYFSFLIGKLIKFKKFFLKELESIQSEEFRRRSSIL